jgi:hypothetical protein
LDVVVQYSVVLSSVGGVYVGSIIFVEREESMFITIIIIHIFIENNQQIPFVDSVVGYGVVAQSPSDDESQTPFLALYCKFLGHTFNTFKPSTQM